MIRVERMMLLAASLLWLFCGEAFSQVSGSTPPASGAPAASASSSIDNGIHVNAPKVHDSRELTLMLDELSEALRGKQFVDPVALAKALGNTQGYSNTDFSQAIFANGGVGSQAAAVFAGTLGSPGDSSSTSSSDSTSTSSGVTINVSPTQNAGTGTSTSTGSSSGLGPQAPSLPTLQTAPTYTPTYGLNSSDTLSDEVNITYQLYNVRMLLNRSLTDRLYNKKSRLQAVVQFDIDIEKDKIVEGAAAIIEVSPKMTTLSDGKKIAGCDAKAPELVALMPEEGSHNSAALSQRADAFGGAIASSVFSLGYSGQHRSQTFYVYRDMDTLSFQTMKSDGTIDKFGWQFRPVLGKASVDQGLRHMMVVLSLPCQDEGLIDPPMDFTVTTRWVRYDSKQAATDSGKHFWQRPVAKAVTTNFDSIAVPSTLSFQSSLMPTVSKVSWIPSQDNSGLAVVEGANFFPGTSVRLGSKVYRSSADGLTIKSDKELEIAVPLNLSTIGGVLSGRYGDAIQLVNPPSGTESVDCKLTITFLKAYQIGADSYQVVSDIKAANETKCGHKITRASFDGQVNALVALINGTPISYRPIVLREADDKLGLELATIVPADTVHKMTSFGIAVPFASRLWGADSPYAEAGLLVKRLGTPEKVVLIVSSTSAAINLCAEWKPQITKDDLPFDCLDKTHNNIVRLTLDSSQLKGVHQLIFVNTAGSAPPFTVDIPKGTDPPKDPALDKDQRIVLDQYDVKTVGFTGKNLDAITKAYFDSLQLKIVQQDSKKIVISIPAVVTAKARPAAELQLVPDGGDPLIAPFIVNPAPKGK